MSPQFPGAGRTRAWHHHGSHTPTSPGDISLGKIAYHTKQIRRQCNIGMVPDGVKSFFENHFIFQAHEKIKCPFRKDFIVLTTLGVRS